MAARGSRFMTGCRRPGASFCWPAAAGSISRTAKRSSGLLDRYGAAKPRLRAAIEAFSPAALRAWCEGLGQRTFVGSSGRVFPQALKASPLLRAWLRRLGRQESRFEPRHRWTGWDAARRAELRGPAGTRERSHADAAVLALGGASWPRLGSDGGWVAAVAKAGIDVTPLMPANCGFIAAWSDVFCAPLRGPAAQAHRSCPLRATPSAARRSSRAAGSRAARSTRCRRRCATRSRRAAKR